MGFSIRYRFIIFLSMTFIEFEALHSNLLLCWHGFRDVNVTVNVGIRWRRQSCFCGCLVNLTICITTYDWPTNHSPPNIIHDWLLIWTTPNQFTITLVIVLAWFLWRQRHVIIVDPLRYWPRYIQLLPLNHLWWSKSTGIRPQLFPLIGWIENGYNSTQDSSLFNGL